MAEAALDYPGFTDGWLAGLEETWAERECAYEDVDKFGHREGNTCIASEPGELDFPDDWCERCYTLFVVRQARESLAKAVAHAAE